MISIKNIDYMKKVLLQDVKGYRKALHFASKDKNRDDFEGIQEAIIRIKEIEKKWDENFDILFQSMINNPELELINDEDKHNLICRKGEKHTFKFLNNAKKITFICFYNLNIITLLNSDQFNLSKDYIFTLGFHKNNSFGMSYKNKNNIRNYYFDNKLGKKVNKDAALFINNKLKILTQHLSDFGMPCNYTLSSSISKDGLFKSYMFVEHGHYTYSKVFFNKHVDLRYTYSVMKKTFKSQYGVNKFKDFKIHHKRKIEIDNYIDELIASGKSNSSGMNSVYKGDIIRLYVYTFYRPSFFVSIPLDLDVSEIKNLNVRTDKGQIDYTFNDWIENPEEVLNCIELVDY